MNLRPKATSTLLATKEADMRVTWHTYDVKLFLPDENLFYPMNPNEFRKAVLLKFKPLYLGRLVLLPSSDAFGMELESC